MLGECVAQVLSGGHDEGLPERVRRYVFHYVDGNEQVLTNVYMDTLGLDGELRPTVEEMIWMRASDNAFVEDDEWEGVFWPLGASVFLVRAQSDNYTPLFNNYAPADAVDRVAAPPEKFVDASVLTMQVSQELAEGILHMTPVYTPPLFYSLEDGTLRTLATDSYWVNQWAGLTNTDRVVTDVLHEVVAYCLSQAVLGRPLDFASLVVINAKTNRRSLISARLNEVVTSDRFADSLHFKFLDLGWEPHLSEKISQSQLAYTRHHDPKDDPVTMRALDRPFLNKERIEDYRYDLARDLLLERADPYDHEPGALERIIEEARQEGASHPGALAVKDMEAELRDLGLLKRYNKLKLPAPIVLEAALLRFADPEDWRLSVTDLLDTVANKGTVDPDRVRAELSWHEIAEICAPEAYDRWRQFAPIRVVELSANELSYEGAALGHCVGRRSMGYYDAVVKGHRKIYSIQTSKGKRLFTVEMDTEDVEDVIEQVKGRYNRHPGFQAVSARCSEFDRDEFCIIATILDKAFPVEDDFSPLASHAHDMQLGHRCMDRLGS